MARVAFLGLGVMGYPMAGHLSKAGHQVTVWNRTLAKAEAWAGAHKGEAASTPADAVFGAEYVMLCLGDDPDVAAVYEQLEPSVGGGMVIIDHTTASADLARSLFQRASKKGAAFIDAPISGGQAGAEKGQLTIMCGGDASAFAQAQPIMSAYGKRMTLIGESGAGQLAKSVNQICIAGILQGLAEGLHFADQAGLDISKVIGAISGGAAQSWQMENRWETMDKGEYEHGFAVDWMRKDLRIALETARQNGASLPLTAMVDQYYADIQAMGGQRWDTSSLLARMGRGPK
ncbi:MAG: NAD(P)-dependent oxidoreductase [Hyphomonadaceae bacterium]|nr:NAD(P)-dependent oxidoreductase [Hyphomonadaceae bacterium]